MVKDTQRLAAPNALRVLMAGPPIAKPGGMSAVSTLLRDEIQRAHSSMQCEVLDSGGGTGIRGYLKFPVAMHHVYHLDYDVLHLHVASSGSTLRKGLLAAIAAARGIPYVVHLHGGGYAEFLDRLRPWSRWLVRRFFLDAAVVLVLGDVWQSRIVDALDLPPRRIRVVPNGVNELAPGIPPTTERPGNEILFLGEINEDKGVDVLLDVIQPLLQEAGNEKWRLKLVGPYPDPALGRRARFAATRTDGRVEMTGPLVGSAKSARFLTAGVFCLPSRTEALPIVLLEAMSAGLPCVCSRVGAIPEVVHDNVNGLLVPPGDRTSLNNALAQLLSDQDLRFRLGKAAKETWRDNYTAQQMTAAVVDSWKLAASLARHRAPPSDPSPRRSR